MIQVGRQLEAPGTSQQEINANSAIVEVRYAKVSMSPEAVGMLWIIPLRR